MIYVRTYFSLEKVCSSEKTPYEVIAESYAVGRLTLQETAHSCLQHLNLFKDIPRHLKNFTAVGCLVYGKKSEQASAWNFPSQKPGRRRCPWRATKQRHGRICWVHITVTCVSFTLLPRMLLLVKFCTKCLQVTIMCMSFRHSKLIFCPATS